MADPMTELFGRRAFRGTGRTADYFPEAPDLAFLDRPVFNSAAGYNPNLDPESLVAAGFSPRNAMLLQGVRQDFHDRAEMESDFMDTQRAMDGLSRLNPSGKGFSKELLSIFQNNPRAMRNPEVLQRADFISRFATPQASWSVEDIEDPDIYDQAVKENWGALTPQEARRRANTAMGQRTMRGELAALGMTRAELDKIPSWSQEDFLREKGRLMRAAKASPREALGSSELNKFNEAMTAYNDAAAGVDVAATPEAKIEVFKQRTGREPVSAQDWQDAYMMVKDSTMASPRQSLQQLVELYQGRDIPEVVLRTLGITPQAVQAASPQTAPAWPEQAPTSIGTGLPGSAPAPATSATPPQAPAPVPPVVSPQVSPADLKRLDAPQTFESLAAQVAQRGESAKKSREDEYLSRQKVRDQEGAQWEDAKMKLLQGITPDMIAGFSASPTQETFDAILRGAGVDNSKPAFTKPNGSPVSWYEVLTLGLAQDPRIKQLQNPEQPQRTTKSFSSLWGGKGS
jgi:hypothetical protein